MPILAETSIGPCDPFEYELQAFWQRSNEKNPHSVYTLLSNIQTKFSNFWIHRPAKNITRLSKAVCEQKLCIGSCHVRVLFLFN